MIRRTTLVLPAVAALALGGLDFMRVSAQPTPIASPRPVVSATPQTGGTPGLASPEPLESVSPSPSESPSPQPTPTQPPIIVEPPSTSLAPGATATLRVMGALGEVSVTVADPSIAEATADQATRTIVVTGRAVGRTSLTVSDQRGLTRDVAVRVAYPAGSIADAASVRITGNAATSSFVKEQALQAALKRVFLRPGATIVANTDSIVYEKPLRVDNVVSLGVPIILQGSDYLTVTGTTRVRVENFAQPPLRPGSLLVSDYPETLHANGILFSADLTMERAERFLYYHYNPPQQPDRRIVLKIENPSSQPALLQFISGQAGPGPYEMEVGHLSTQRFLVHLSQNEGTVVTIPAGTTTTLVDQLLPAGSIVSNLLQLHEITGKPLHLTLLAQNAGDPIEGPVPPGALLGGGVPHARGIYPTPEFFFFGTYDTEGEDLEMSIGHIPLPNLVQGQVLSGDYGVLQQFTVTLINGSKETRNVALYANPRGGRATGTFLIDGILVQAHALPAFSHFKLRQYTIPPQTYIQTEIKTMPEGGSSYPLRLIVAPDDGSPPPGAPDSLIY